MARAMTYSPVALGKEARAMAQEALPAYSGPFSPKVFTRHRLFAILVLRQFFRTDYRGVVQMLRDFSDLLESVISGHKRRPDSALRARDCQAQKQKPAPVTEALRNPSCKS
jgi:hypothetical protein